jgi:hypothetical protein
MGFKVSWIAFHGTGRDAALEKLGFRDTGEPDEANEAPFSGAEIPNGWFVVFANDFDFISPKRLASLSRGCRLIACRVHEGVMFSGAFFYQDGERVSEISHDAQVGVYDLSVLGSPPKEFQSIRDSQMKQQDEEGGDEAEVDCIFEIPIETAAAICGYRHDRGRFDWGEPKFARLAQL